MPRAAALPIDEIVGSGGGEAQATQRLRRALAERGWRKTRFDIRKTINGVERESQSHEVDHVKAFEGAGSVALEIEWNNKDPFFDRDLENFKRLHAEGAISVGIIITRGANLQDALPALVSRYAGMKQFDSIEAIRSASVGLTKRQEQAIMERSGRARRPLALREAWTSQFVSDKFGQATTHWRKLMNRVERGVGNPCPMMLIGMPKSIVTFDA